MIVFQERGGNCHPLLNFDPKDQGIMERFFSAGEEHLQASIDAGGVLSGEHGIGLEKKGFMEKFFTQDDLEAQRLLKKAFDPDERANPFKVLPSGASCSEVNHLKQLPDGTWI